MKISFLKENFEKCLRLHLKKPQERFFLFKLLVLLLWLVWAIKKLKIEAINSQLSIFMV